MHHAYTMQRTTQHARCIRRASAVTRHARAPHRWPTRARSPRRAARASRCATSRSLTLNLTLTPTLPNPNPNPNPSPNPNQVHDVKKFGAYVLHVGVVTQGMLKVGDEATP